MNIQRSIRLAIALSLGRLRQRLTERPGWYRNRGEIVGPDFYDAA